MDFRRVTRLVAIVVLVATVATSASAITLASMVDAAEHPTESIDAGDVEGVAAVQDDGSDNGSDDNHWIGPGGSDDEESDSGDEEENASDGEGEDGDDDGGVVDSVTDSAGSVADSLNPASSVLSPQEAAEDVAEWWREQLQETVVWLVDEVFNNLMGTPQMENDGYRGITGSPVDASEIAESDYDDPYAYSAAQNYSELYESVYLPYIIPLVASVVSLMALMVLIAPAISAFTRRRMLGALGSAAVCVFLIVASWEFAALLHTFSDAVTQEFLPDGEEVVQSDITAAAGPLALTLLLLIKGVVTGLTLLAIHGIRHMLLFIAPIVLPVLILMAYWGGARKIKQVGSFFIWQYYALLVWNWPTALLLRIAYELEWSFHSSEIINFGMTMAIFMVAIALPLAVSGSFGLIGLSMRGAAVGAAGAMMGTARSATPGAPSLGGASRTRSAASRLKRGGMRAGISAKNRTKAAYSRSRWSSSAGSSTSTPRSGTPNNWNPNEKLGSGSRGSARSRHRSESVSPTQRRRAARSRMWRSSTNRTD